MSKISIYVFANLILTVCFWIILIIPIVVLVYLHWLRKKNIIHQQKYRSSCNSRDGSLLGSAESLPRHPLDAELSRSSIIGHGRFSSVEKVTWNDHNYAMKVFNVIHFPKYNRERKLYMENYLTHPNIVRFICCNENRPCSGHSSFELMFELYNGDLRNHLYEFTNQLEYYDAIGLCSGIVKGLKFLHTEYKTSQAYKPSICHCDLKPENIFMKDSKTCVIGDLGAAVLREGRDSVDLTSNGTKRYRSPEFLNSKIEITSFKQYINNDIYSLSLVSLEIFCNVKELSTGYNFEAVTILQRGLGHSMGRPTLNEINNFFKNLKTLDNFI